MDDRQPGSATEGQTEGGLPLEDYDSLSAEEIVRKLPELGPEEVERLCRYEKAHKKRRSLLRYFDGRIGSAAATAGGAREDPPPGEERPGKRREAEMGTIAREDPAPGEERPERRVPYSSEMPRNDTNPREERTDRWTNSSSNG